MAKSAHQAGCRRVDDWLSLEGAKAAIVQEGRTLAEGFVDAVTEDGSILWLQDDIGQRKLYETCEFHEAWVPCDHTGLNYKISKSAI